ncbi:hypothetical protein PHMEG_00014140 [Phytophthora megakarya]|uniref:MULE transposase domain-containing protein n=1 Tax=Phytophthora megakarya TaxID=4795 RepID=A0A225W4J5_9STRA|nr:hypothetical protein PHMEG_00014140 [Phytophthora megakarya]
MYYRDTLEILPQHILHQLLQRVHSSLPVSRECQKELLEWGSKIRKRFVLDNMLSLPIQHVKDSLSMEEQSEQFVGLHTFAETLDCLLTGHQQLLNANDDLKSMMYRLLDRIDHLEAVSRCFCNTDTATKDRENSEQQRDPIHRGTSALTLRAPRTSTAWPKSLTTLEGKHLSDVLVQFFMEGLGSLPKLSANRSQKDCARAVEIIDMLRSDADILLDTFKAFSIAWSDVGQCNICADAAPHAMRTQLLRCRCEACSAAAPATPCPWRGRVRACQEHDVVAVDELLSHVTHVRPLARPRLTPSMKELARDWAAQGLRPAPLIQRFGLNEETAPPLSAIQRFVYHHITTTLGGSDRMGAIRLKLRETGFRGREEANTAFTFTWRTDSDGRPVVGNGSDAHPFVVGVTTKKLLRQADRDPASFILHVDDTYKLTQTGFPVIVIGMSDRARKFHLLAIFIVSQQQQTQYAEVLSMLSKMFFLK